MSQFSNTENWPVYPDISTEQDFVPASVTNLDFIEISWPSSCYNKQTPPARMDKAEDTASSTPELKINVEFPNARQF